MSPMFTCSEEMTMPPYEAVQGSHLMLTETYSKYLSLKPVSVSLPVVTYFSDAISQKTGYEGSEPVDEDLPPYMSYSGHPLPGVDLSTGQPSPWTSTGVPPTNGWTFCSRSQPLTSSTIWQILAMNSGMTASLMMLSLTSQNGTGPDGHQSCGGGTVWRCLPRCQPAQGNWARP